MADEEDTGLVSLEALADFDVTDVEEVRFELLPEMVGTFELKEAGLGEWDTDDGKIPYVEFKSEILEVDSMSDESKSPDKYVGKFYVDKVKIDPEDPLAGLGRVRARVTDMGGDSSGKLGPMLQNAVGLRFPASLVHTKNKNDPSNPYVNMRFKSKSGEDETA